MISQEPELGPGLLESLWRFKWPVLAVAVAGAVAGFFYASSQPLLYRASARLLLEDPRSRIVLSESSDYFIDSSRFVRNQAQVVTSETVLRRAAETLDLPPGTLAVSADPLLDIDAIDVSAVDVDPERAAATVDAVGAAYEVVTRQATQAAGEAAIEELELARREVEDQLTRIEQSQELDEEDPVLTAERDAATDQLQTLATRIRQLSVDTALAGSGVKHREQAFVPSSPYRPRPLRTAGAAGILALILASALAWWWNTRHPPRGLRHDADRILVVPRIGEIPPFDAGSSPIPSADAPRSPAGEAYQFLAAAVSRAMERAGASSLLITSAQPGEGKTVTALNLGVVNDRGGTSVILVDADERFRSLTAAAGVTITVGLPQVASEGVPAEWALAKPAIEGTSRLRVTGMIEDDAVANPADFFRSDGFSVALSRLKQECDLVIVDAPPLLAVADASAIASEVDAVLIVIDQKTPDEMLTEMRRRLDLIGAVVLGYVVNRADLVLSPYSYGDGYSPDSKPAAWSTAAPAAPSSSSS